MQKRRILATRTDRRQIDQVLCQLVNLWVIMRTGRRSGSHDGALSRGSCGPAMVVAEPLTVSPILPEVTLAQKWATPATTTHTIELGGRTIVTAAVARHQAGSCQETKKIYNFTYIFLILTHRALGIRSPPVLTSTDAEMMNGDWASKGKNCFLRRQLAEQSSTCHWPANLSGPVAAGCRLGP